MHREMEDMKMIMIVHNRRGSIGCVITIPSCINYNATTSTTTSGVGGD